MQFACDLIGAKYRDYETNYGVIVERQMLVAQHESQIPSFTKGRLEVRRGLRTIREPHLRAVPFQPAAFETKSDDTKKREFGQRAAIVEVGAARRAGFTGLDPFFVVARGFG